MEAQTKHAAKTSVKSTQGLDKWGSMAPDWSAHKRLKPSQVNHPFSFIVTRVVVVGALLAAFLLIDHTVRPPVFSGWVQVVVNPGDSEWSIALDHGPKVDTRDVVEAMEGRNHIGDVIQPGERIWVPTKAFRPWLVVIRTAEK